ncbi:WD40 repeat domain-containing protein [Thalassotalea sp. M1531]|uniref:WD40 repeat domain-containing protein n=1 Tax=Thalassotalea algicola TaxID=2716224 RepID=A0A7Y0LDF1_9GAMM|nr:WD40 repeat domain-containing protein [Thalassotalea algicola]NMP31120.1 WD40 repeat domain-containing protein [Thalassotalea algicola]
MFKSQGFMIAGLSTFCTLASQLPDPQSLNKHYNCNVTKNSFCRADIHPNNRLMVTGSDDRYVKLWRKSTGEVISKLEHEYGAPAVEFSSDGKYLATGSYDNHVRLWRLSDNQLINTFPGDEGFITTVTFSHDNQLIASASTDDKVRIWDIKTGDTKVLSGHQGDVWGLIFSHDNKYIISGSEDDSIFIWSTETGKKVRELKEHSGAVLQFALSKDGRTLASGGDDHSIKLWDTKTWQLMDTIEGGFYSVYALAFSPNGKVLASGGRDRGGIGEFFQYHFDRVNDDNEPTVFFWNVKTKQLLQTMSDHSDDVNKITYSDDGQSFTSSSVDGNVNVYSVVQLGNEP